VLLIASGLGLWRRWEPWALAKKLTWLTDANSAYAGLSNDGNRLCILTPNAGFKVIQISNWAPLFKISLIDALLERERVDYYWPEFSENGEFLRVLWGPMGSQQVYHVDTGIVVEALSEDVKWKEIGSDILLPGKAGLITLPDSEISEFSSCPIEEEQSDTRMVASPANQTIKIYKYRPYSRAIQLPEFWLTCGFAFAMLWSLLAVTTSSAPAHAPSTWILNRAVMFDPPDF